MESMDGRVVATINGFKKYDNGGEGSGNFGHEGRPGKVGGSGKGTGTASSTKKETKVEKDKRGAKVPKGATFDEKGQYHSPYKKKKT